MVDRPDWAILAGLIADPTRSEILLCLMDGRSFPVSDLAAIAHVSLPTASHHLELLVDGRLVVVERRGRHRYHRIADDRVAELLEHLGAFQGVKERSVPLSGTQKALSDCRVCYKHLAGSVGVQIRRSLEVRGFLSEFGGQYALSQSGISFLLDLGLESSLVESVKQHRAKACLDWTERVPHIGGPLGRALFENLIERKWMVRGELPRLIVVTALGKKGIAATFPCR